MNLERQISRSLSLPRRITTAMRDSLRANPTKALRYGSLVDHLAEHMARAYRLGYRKRGDTLKRETRSAKKAEYRKMARAVLTQYQVSANKELKRVYRETRRRGRTHQQGVAIVLRRFRSLGIEAPAANRMKTLYTSALTSAYNEGVWDADRLDAQIWGFRWKTAGDARVRHPTHTQFEGVTLPKEHPFWLQFWPPLQFGCRCRIKSLRRKQKIVRPPPNPVPVGDGFHGQKFELK